MSVPRCGAGRPSRLRVRAAQAACVVAVAVLLERAVEADPAPAPAPVQSAARAAGTPDPKRVDAALAQLKSVVEREGGRLTAEVVRMSDGRTVGAIDAHLAVNPASNAKILTAVAALDALGAEQRFVTGLYGRPRAGRVDPLVLRGTGDPGLETEHLAVLVRELRTAGVDAVGSILVDQSRFDDRYVPPAFDQQPNEWAPFRAPVAPVSIARNTVTLWFRAGEKKGEPAFVVVDPPGFVDVQGAVTTGAKGSAENIGLTLEPRGPRLLASVSGKIPEGSALVAGIRRVDDPRLLAGYALRAVLREQGIPAGDLVELGGKDEKRALALHRSATVGELLPRLGKDSDNFTAEMLFKAIGAARKGSPAPAAASDAVTDVLRARGAFVEGLRITNGSGLFDANRLSAHSVATLLASAARDPRIAHEMIAHLAIGGVDGTMRGRFAKWRDRRAIRAKTGTLARSVALSGYVLDPLGHPAVAFSLLVETPPGKTAAPRAAIDEAVDAIATAIWE